MKKEENGINFEEAMAKLSRIVEKLEGGNIPLEEALKQFDAGVKLVKYLNDKLEDAERRIEVLIKEKNGRVKTKRVEVTDDGLREPGDKTGELF